MFDLSLIILVQARYHDAERDCCATESSDFEGGSTVEEGSKTFKWKCNPFRGSRFVEEDGWN